MEQARAKGGGSTKPAARPWRPFPGRASLPRAFLRLFLPPLLFLSPGAPGHAGVETTKEYQVKAACLFNFAKFVEWPAEAFAAPDAPLVIGILGEDPLGGALREIIEGQKAGGRPLVIRRSDRIEDLKACQMVFIGRAAADRSPGALAALADPPVLTVGESAGFATRDGGVINFTLVRNKVRFQVNMDVAERKKLKINSQMLQVAIIIRNGVEAKGEQP